MNLVSRVNLKTGTKNRKCLIDFCLNQPEHQYLAIGWSEVYKENEISPNYEDYYKAVKELLHSKGKKTNNALNLFLQAKENDLFWTRDLYGNYWICRAIGQASSYYRQDIDVGAVIPIEAYCYGLEVPGQIKAAFNRPNGGTAQKIKDPLINEFSKYAFNICSKVSHYHVNVNIQGDIIGNLPDFELEELVIAYIQIKFNYYVLSNSIANKSTTISIECEFRSKTLQQEGKAVVQVKGGKRIINAKDYQEYCKKGFTVFLYAGSVIHTEDVPNIVAIDKEDLLNFYHDYKSILPDSVTQWENLFFSD